MPTDAGEGFYGKRIFDLAEFQAGPELGSILFASPRDGDRSLGLHVENTLEVDLRKERIGFLTSPETGSPARFENLQIGEGLYALLMSVHRADVPKILANLERLKLLVIKMPDEDISEATELAAEWKTLAARQAPPIPTLTVTETESQHILAKIEAALDKKV